MFSIFLVTFTCMNNIGGPKEGLSHLQITWKFVFRINYFPAIGNISQN